MIGYILLTYGAKPTTKIEAHPAARQQVMNLRDVESRSNWKWLSVQWDYCRKIRRLTDLPRLYELLEQIRSKDAGAVVMDDVGRILRSCPDEARQGVLFELMDYGRHIFSIRHGKLVDDLPDGTLAGIAKEKGPRRFAPYGVVGRPTTEKQRQDQTKKARLASDASRWFRANEKAFQLDEVRADLLGRHTKVTNGMIAAEANKRGLLTSRNKPWRHDTVARSLARLDDPIIRSLLRKHKAERQAETDKI